MTHKQWLSKNDKVRDGELVVTCEQVPEYKRRTFSMDVSWEIYLCPCGQEVVTVGGGVHNWNYQREWQPSPDWTDAERLRVVALIASKTLRPLCWTDAAADALDVIIQVSMQPASFLETIRAKIMAAMEKGGARQ